MANQDLSDAEKIRLKRLAKLQGPSNNNNNNNNNNSGNSGNDNASNTNTNSRESPSVAPNSNNNNNNNNSDNNNINNTSNSGQRSSSSSSITPSNTTNHTAPSKHASNTPASSSATTQQPPKANSTATKSTPAAPAPVEPFEQWEPRIISNIFQVTLKREVAEKSSWNITWLKELAQELMSEADLTEPPKLSGDIADRLLISRLSLSTDNMSDDPEVITVVASLPPNMSTFEYLITCWKRQVLCRSDLAKASLDKDQKRIQVLNTVCDLIISYAGLSIQDPSMFPQPADKPVGIPEMKNLLLHPSKHHILTEVQVSSFLTALERRFSEDGLEDVFGPALKSISTDVITKQIDINSLEWREPVMAYRNLVESKPLAAMLTQIDNWDFDPNSTTTPLIEHQILLGPLIRLGCFPDAFPQVTASWFPNADSLTNNDVAGIWPSLQNTVNTHQKTLFNIFNAIIRSSPTARENVLSLWGHIANSNMKRAAMHVDPLSISSDGFIINLQSVIFDFATPFLDAAFSKIDKVNSLYYKLTKRLNIYEETKIKATQDESDKYYHFDSDDNNMQEEPNFISEIFFLCIHYFHIGSLKLIHSNDSKYRQLQRMKEEYERASRNNPHAGTPQEAIFNQQLERFRKEIDKVRAEIYTIQGILLDSRFLQQQVSFFNFVMVWIVRLLDPKHLHPSTTISLPLPENTPTEFAMLPEFILEDIAEFFLFIGKTGGKWIMSQPMDQLLVFILVILSSPYIRNPYMKGQFVEIIYFLSSEFAHRERGTLYDALQAHPLALKFLTPALVTNFIEIENTGSHSQFYDKFNTRYYISKIFSSIWTNSTHRQALITLSRDSNDFIRFVNYMMNDTTFLLDEVLTRLAKINKIQNEMSNADVWNAFTDQEREDRESDYRQSEGSVKSYNIFAKESLRLFVTFTEATPEQFVVPEIVDRLAAMLDLNLVYLAGPKMQDLKVSDPKKYGFKARDLLANLLQIFLNLAGQADFAAAIARDGRSYNKELFYKASAIAIRNAIKTEQELEPLRKLVDSVEEIKANELEEDEEMGDVPDEYLDPLTYVMMKDPVRLPTSKTVVDRSTIVQHLLSEETDPFNRMPMKMEEVVPEPEIKKEIEEYVAKRKASRKPKA